MTVPVLDHPPGDISRLDIQSTPRPPAWGVILLLGLGLLLYFPVRHHPMDDRAPLQRWVTIAAVLLAAIPMVNRWLLAQFDRARHPSSITAAGFQTLITFLSAGYFLYTASHQNRLLEPRVHDEQMYTIQSHMLAHGRLWFAAHPLADFFETFHVFVRPFYAPMYFPGTALMFVPAVWLEMNLCVWAALIAGTIVGMAYRIGLELWDGTAGLLAALMMLASPMLHYASVMVMSHPVNMLLGMCLYWAWLRRRRRPAWTGALAIGLLAGWMAITRPLDALCLVLPVGIAMLLQLRGQPAKRWLATAMGLIIGATPFLLLQGVFDYHITGNVLQTPTALYNQIYWPGTLTGFRPVDPGFHAPSPLPQFQAYYQYLVPEINDHAKNGLLLALRDKILPNLLPLSLVSPLLLPLVALGLKDLLKRAWAIPAALPLFIVGYGFYPFMQWIYTLAITPAMLCLVLGGVAVLRQWSRRAYVLAIVVSIAICATALHELNPGVRDATFNSPGLVKIHRALANIHEPAVVLFHFADNCTPIEEPVYNYNSAWPDDSQIIRAHDLGPRNIELYRYYAKIAPQRIIYRYDRGTDHLERLGTAQQLAATQGGGHD